MNLDLVRGDITTMDVDAIVNAANNALQGGGGVDGAIHRAGGAAIDEECREIRRTTWPDGLPTGRAVATSGGLMHVRWVIHTVGPVYSASEDRAEQLRSAYTESLAVADELGAASMAFPLISAGIFGWPRDDAVRQAFTAIGGATTSVEQVTLVLFDEVTFMLAEQIRDSA